MGKVIIGGVSDDIIAIFQDKAVRGNTMLEAILRDALVNGVMRPRLELSEQLQNIRDKIRAASGEQLGCTANIRDGRDIRW